MFAEKHLASLLPLRLPHWRLNRVTEMLRHRPQPLPPRSLDDHPIRAYRRMLLDLLTAGEDDEKLNAIKEELPAVYAAHQYHYSPDVLKRQEIEARLLARQSLEEIASQLGADPKGIDYYASVFFDVRDALDHFGWVSVMIKIRMRYDAESGCSRAEAERGYVMRLFAYFGGPLVLDVLMNALGQSKPPENAEEIRAWSEEAGTLNIRVMGAAAAATIEVTGKNKMQLIRLAMRMIRGRKTDLRPGCGLLKKNLDAALAWFDKSGLK